MPYVGLTITGNSNIRHHLQDEQKHLNFSDTQIARAEKFELVHSSFTDPGNDWNSWRLYDKNNEVIAITTIDGY